MRPKKGRAMRCVCCGSLETVKNGSREIARLFGVSPNTVFNALARDEPPAHKRTSVPNPDLDLFREVIVEVANVQGFRG